MKKKTKQTPTPVTVGLTWLLKCNVSSILLYYCIVMHYACNGIMLSQEPSNFAWYSSHTSWLVTRMPGPKLWRHCASRRGWDLRKATPREDFHFFYSIAVVKPWKLRGSIPLCPKSLVFCGFCSKLATKFQQSPEGMFCSRIQPMTHIKWKPTDYTF